MPRMEVVVLPSDDERDRGQRGEGQHDRPRDGRNAVPPSGHDGERQRDEEGEHDRSRVPAKNTSDAHVTASGSTTAFRG